MWTEHQDGKQNVKAAAASYRFAKDPNAVGAAAGGVPNLKRIGDQYDCASWPGLSWLVPAIDAFTYGMTGMDARDKRRQARATNQVDVPSHCHRADPNGIRARSQATFQKDVRASVVCYPASYPILPREARLCGFGNS
jgi:hypothetical protein